MHDKSYIWRYALAPWYALKKTAVLAALFLTACTTPPHTPERDGVWITKPREMVRCWETKEGVVCRSDRVIQAESLGQ